MTPSFIADVTRYIIDKVQRPLNPSEVERQFLAWREKYPSGVTILSPAFVAFTDQLREHYDCYDAQSVDGEIVAI